MIQMHTYVHYLTHTHRHIGIHIYTHTCIHTYLYHIHNTHTYKHGLAWEFQQANTNKRYRHQAKETTEDTNDTVLKARVGTLSLLYTLSHDYDWRNSYRQTLKKMSSYRH